MVARRNTGVRREMARAVRRLNILEYLILAAAGAMSLGGGALVALLLRELTDAPFRISWFVSSLLLFSVPGFFVLRRESGRDPTRGGADDSNSSTDGQDRTNG